MNHGFANRPARTLSRKLPFYAEPAAVFAGLAHRPGAILLECQPGARGGWESMICADPFACLVTEGGRTVLHRASGDSEFPGPFDALREVLIGYSLPCSGGFTGGAVGYLGYELHALLESTPVTSPYDGPPDCRFGLYNAALLFNTSERQITVTGCALPDAPDPLPLMDALEKLARNAGSPEERRVRMPDGLIAASCFSKTEYCDAVRRVKEYIAAGDIYQVNLSQRYVIEAETDPWELFTRLRDMNPAPYAAYLNAGESHIVSSSPECFLIYDPGDRRVETRPIKGTRPRHADAEEDRRLADELARSGKDLAENIMIVDLERNDLGRVCEFGTVTVPGLTCMESHPTVHHLVSTIVGRLSESHDVVDLLEAAFPGGSITGAPKIRAIEIIDELEPVRRGVYTGSIGYLGFDGSLHMNIAIRTAVVTPGRCSFHVGGGIVADSDPDLEYQETLDKGRAFFEVLGCRPAID